MTIALRRNRSHAAPLWFLHDLMVPLAGPADTEGTVGLIEGLFPAGDATPLHIHHHDHEAWYLLEGEATFFCGGEQVPAVAGDFIWAPKGVEHAIRVGEAGPARMLVMAFPGRFVDFVAELGVPAPERRLPDPYPLDPQRLAEVAARHGIDIVGPPPG